MSRFITAIGLITTIFLCFFDTTAYAQKRQLRDSLVQDFKSGTLIIRLKSYENKLNSIEELLQNSNTSTSYRKRLTEKRDLIIANRDRFNQDLVATFSKNYHFTEIRFLYDRDVKRFQAGELDGVFLGPDLTPLSEVKPVVGSYYFFGEGFTQMSGNSREGLLVMDKNGDQLPSWFPSYLRAKSNGKSFFAMFGGDRYPYLPAKKILEKFLKGLNKL
jgi:hypothetical protein